MKKIHLTDAKSILISNYMSTTSNDYTCIHKAHQIGVYKHLKQIGLLEKLFTYHNPDDLESVFNEYQRNVIIAFMHVRYEESSICTDDYIMKEYIHMLETNSLHELFEY
ncbi:hypothetical protein [Winogradskyella helgolandensis]|uniref:hypothetical protein n=1 Tax=Winogradskyella helgolandensis TaxID=2697010 RepID=UPI0015BEBD55|nr:hypothetical protein [Winogradskyella helgolandensis]